MGVELTIGDFSVFAIYILAVMALGWLASRRTKSSKRDYFLAGDKLGWLMIGGSMMAANISSHHFVGIMGVAYSRGLVAMNIAWPAVIYCFGSLLLIFLPFYVRNGFYTLPEFLNRRYGAAARTTYAGLILLTYTFVEISAVLLLGSIALHALFPSLPDTACIAILAVFTGVYTITGGLRAVVWTEMLQLGVLVVGGVTLSVLTVYRAFNDPKIGADAISRAAQNWHLVMPATDPAFPWTMYIGASLGIGIFYGAVNQFMVQRALAAKDEWNARMGVAFASILNLLMPLVYILPGMLAPLVFASMGITIDRPDATFATLVETLLPNGMIGLVMAGLVAAIMSHISGSLNSCATIATIDFYLPYIRKKASEREAVLFGRIVAAIIVVIAIWWAILMIPRRETPVFLTLLNIYGYFAPGLTVMFLVGVFWKRATHAGAMAAGLLTIPLTVFLDWLTGSISLPGLTPPHLPAVATLYLSPFMNRTGIVFWCCMLTAIVVSLFTRPEPEEKLKGMIWSVDSLSLPKDQRAQMRGLRNPILWWGLSAAILVALYIAFH